MKLLISSILIFILFSCKTTAPTQSTPIWDMGVFPTLPEMEDITLGGDLPDTNIDVDSYMLKKGEFYLGPSINDQMILSIRYDTLMLYTPLKIHYIKVDGALYKITLVSDFYQRIESDSTKEWYSLPTTIDNFKIK